jgi:DNA mismatch endonuclease (patch repair protein)
MTDVFVTAKRSEIMSRIGGKDSAPELRVRRILHAMGYRYRLHPSDLPGRPDIVLPRHRKIILVHGCFWHCHRGCPRATIPSTNVVFWKKKLSANVARDKRVERALRKLGWDVLTLWQCELRDASEIERRLRSFFG